jgi:thymidylate synthase (FAD)
MHKVKLIGITQPVEDPRVPSAPKTPEDLVAYCARVSNPANQNNPDSKGLLKYLVRNKHWSPYEMVNLVIEIETTRDIARQILRHRSFAFQEFSQRYAEVDNSSFSIREGRLQDHKNRQNSIPTSNTLLLLEWEAHQKIALEGSQVAYRWAIANGLAKEVARSVLPEGMTNSTMYMNGTLRSWIHYCELRMGNGTQKEHREVATSCWEIITKEFPVLKDLLVE